MRLPLLLASCLWLTLGRASSHGNSTATSALSAFEPYCLPVCEGPFPAGSTVPSITMIYSGITLTATPAMLSSGGIVSTMAPAAEPVSSGNSSSGNGSSGNGNGNGSSGNGSSSSNVTDVLSPVPVPTNETSSLRFASGHLSSNRSCSRSADAGLASGASGSPVVTATDSLTDGEGSLASGSGVPVVSGITARSSPGGRTAGATISDASQSAATPPAEDGGPAGPSSAAPTAAPSSSVDDATVSLSPPAVDALQLAQFLKNLIVAVLDASTRYAKRSAWGDGSDASLPARLVADMTTQERTQLDAVQELLRRAGGEAVPPCQYAVPGNATELVSLAAALKAVELGVFMSLVESLPPADSLASTLLSSMAGVAARQNALLRAYRARGVDVEPFETPSSAAWAYNLALGYVRPGSCAVELPLPILPSLAMDGKTMAHAQPGTNVTFGWDAAGRAAALRSGKRLSVGWVNGVNPPVFTPLTVLGDGTGGTGVPPGLSGTAFAVLTAQPDLVTIDELTAATLAGPVVVSLAP